jgi:hypothetical protein
MILTPGSTSIIRHIFIQDSTTSAAKTGLVFGDMTATYVRAGGTLTSMTMETISTLGTWASSGDDYLGFRETAAEGLYELHLPNNILASGAINVAIMLTASGAAPCPLLIMLNGLVTSRMT